jgi:hypothetical protein
MAVVSSNDFFDTSVRWFITCSGRSDQRIDVGAGHVVQIVQALHAGLDGFLGLGGNLFHRGLAVVDGGFGLGVQRLDGGADGFLGGFEGSGHDRLLGRECGGKRNDRGRSRSRLDHRFNHRAGCGRFRGGSNGLGIGLRCRLDRRGRSNLPGRRALGGRLGLGGGRLGGHRHLRLCCNAT